MALKAVNENQNDLTLRSSNKEDAEMWRNALCSVFCQVNLFKPSYAPSFILINLSDIISRNISDLKNSQDHPQTIYPQIINASSLINKGCNRGVVDYSITYFFVSS